ncbi:MAG: hypothetical protein RLZZ221_2681 [Verrucomicrobiota bacterium]
MAHAPSCRRALQVRSLMTIGVVMALVNQALGVVQTVQGSTVPASPLQFRRLVEPQATPVDWDRAARSIGLYDALDAGSGAVADPQPADGADGRRILPVVEEVIAAYQREFTGILEAFAAVAERDGLVEAMRTVATTEGGGGQGMDRAHALEIIARSARYAESSAWPAADRAIEHGFAQLVALVPEGQRQAPSWSARESEARRRLLRDVRLRSIGTVAGRAGILRGVSLEEIVAEAPPEVAIWTRSADSGTSAEADERSQGVPTRDGVRKAVGSTIREWEAEVDSLVEQAYRQHRKRLVRRASSDAPPGAGAPAPDLATTTAFKSILRSLDRAVDRIAEILENSGGPEARGAWEDHAWASLDPTGFSAESPAKVWRWISRRAKEGELEQAIVDRCAAHYGDYLVARIPLRIRMREVLLDARAKFVRLPEEGSAEATVLDAILKQRRALADACIAAMSESLPDEQRALLKRYMEHLQSQEPPDDRFGAV